MIRLVCGCMWKRNEQQGLFLYRMPYASSLSIHGNNLITALLRGVDIVIQQVPTNILLQSHTKKILLHSQQHKSMLSLGVPFQIMTCFRSLIRCTELFSLSPIQSKIILTVLYSIAHYVIGLNSHAQHFFTSLHTYTSHKYKYHM